MARIARKPPLPEWLTPEMVLSAMAERELSARGLLPEVKPLKPLSLGEFVHEFWSVLEPGVDLQWGWVFDAMCLHLEAAARREIRKLIINVPPGTMKSRLTNVFFPAWVWAELDPSERFLAVAYTESLSMADSMAMRRLIVSPEYQTRYGERVQLTRDQNAKGRYDTTARGVRQVKPLTSATGARAGILLIDDPNNAIKVHSGAERKTINDAYDQSLRMRAGNQKTFVQILIMQRLHQEDLTGHLLKKGGWVHLRLPEEYEPEYHTTTPIWSDPRTKRGELLLEAYRDREAVNEMKADLREFGTAGQLQQRPVPAGGGIVKDHWWRYHAPAHLLESLPPVRVMLADGSELEIKAVATPETFDFQLTSWDMTFKDTKSSDYVAGGAWGALGANSYLLDQVHGRMDFVATLRAVREFAARHEDITEHIVEDKANGPAVISALRDELAGMIAWEPDGSKESRVHVESSSIESGNVYIPHPALANWVRELYLPEWSAFPNGPNDDQVDQTTQALARLRLKRKRQSREQDKPPPPTRLTGLPGLISIAPSNWRK